MDKSMGKRSSTVQYMYIIHLLCQNMEKEAPKHKLAEESYKVAQHQVQKHQQTAIF